MYPLRLSEINALQAIVLFRLDNKKSFVQSEEGEMTMATDEEIIQNFKGCDQDCWEDESDDDNTSFMPCPRCLREIMSKARADERENHIQIQFCREPCTNCKCYERGMQDERKKMTQEYKGTMVERLCECQETNNNSFCWHEMRLYFERGKAEGIKQGREEASCYTCEKCQGKMEVLCPKDGVTLIKYQERIASLEKEIEELKAERISDTKCMCHNAQWMRYWIGEAERLRSALKHQTDRNHDYKPDSCSGCEIAEQALDDYKGYTNFDDKNKKEEKS